MAFVVAIPAIVAFAPVEAEVIRSGRRFPGGIALRQIGSVNDGQNPKVVQVGVHDVSIGGCLEKNDGDNGY